MSIGCLIRVPSILVQPPPSAGNQCLGVAILPQRFGADLLQNNSLDVAIYDSICIMHEIVSGELRIRDRR